MTLPLNTHNRNENDEDEDGKKGGDRAKKSEKKYTYARTHIST